MTPFVQKAWAFAKEKHKGQEYSDRPFIYHPRQVYDIIKLLAPKDENLLAAALLHDTLEDTQTTYEDLVKLFNKDVADLVREVTKTGSNTFANLKSLRATILKLADRTANYSNAHNFPPDRLEKYMLKVFWKA